MTTPAPLKSPRRRRSVFALSGAALVVAAGLALVVFRPFGGASAGASADIAPVTKTSFDISASSTGELQAKNQIEIRSELDNDAAVVEIVPEGTRVKKDTLLVRLNDEEIQLKVDEVMPRVETARAEAVAADKSLEIQKSENDSKVRQARLKLDLARLALDQWDKGERVQKEKDIELALDKTEKDLARLEEKFTQSTNLFKEGFLAKNDLQLDEIALRDAKAARAKAELDASTYRLYQRPKDERSKRSDVEEAQAELERTQQQAAMQLDIKVAEANSKKEQLKFHEVRLDKLKKQLAGCTIKAPQDGLVVYGTSAGRNWFDDSPMTVGRKIHPQEVMIVLPDTSEMLAVVRVHESLAGRVKAGQAATVRIDAIGSSRTFDGVVDTIGVMAETSDRWRDPNKREYTIKIALKKAESDIPLKPSMRCDASITLGRVEDAVSVPVQAVFSEEALRYVYTPADSSGSRFVKTPVTIGRRSDTLAEVTAGLAVPSRVLVREPTPAEVVDRPWDEAKLKEVGFALKDGKPVPMAAPKPVAAGTPSPGTTAGDASTPAAADAAPPTPTMGG